jgi:Flp pilus assembly protein TadB
MLYLGDDRSASDSTKRRARATGVRFSIAQYLVVTVAIAVLIQFFLVLTDHSMFGVFAGFALFVAIALVILLRRDNPINGKRS